MHHSVQDPHNTHMFHNVLAACRGAAGVASPFASTRSWRLREASSSAGGSSIGGGSSVGSGSSVRGSVGGGSAGGAGGSSVRQVRCRVPAVPRASHLVEF